MRRLPWGLWLVTVAIGAATSASALGDGIGPFAAYTVFVLAFSTVGALVATLGANGRRFAERFTWDEAARQTEAHLADVCGLGG